MIRWGGKQVSVGAVTGLHERYSGWTGRAWLQVDGPGWRLPVDQNYGEVRQQLREWLPDVPFTADWMDGRFPSAPAGLPGDLVFVIGIIVVGLISGGLGWRFGWYAGLAIALVAAWPLGRLRDACVLRPEGLRAGPPWGGVVPWYEVEELRVRTGRRRVWLWARGRGVAAASIPAALLPAARARARRLGGLELIEADPDSDDRYQAWRAPAVGIPWGIGLGTALAAFFLPDPWMFVTAGALSMIATGLLGLVVVFRADGWGFGSVVMGTFLYGVVLLLVGLAM
ncbi:MAG: hypothetical protein AB8H79_25600 [Myxococcota bacterium]